MVYKVTDETINGIANAIRTKTGSDEVIQVQDFATEILNIETGENTVAAAASARDAEVSAISAASSAQAAKESAAKVVSSVERINDCLLEVEENAKSAVDSAANAESKFNYAVEMVENLEGFNSEAWAVGTRNGEEITSEDVAYQNNSKYWASVARDAVENFQFGNGTANVFATATLVEEVTT